MIFPAVQMQTNFNLDQPRRSSYVDVEKHQKGFNKDQEENEEALVDEPFLVEECIENMIDERMVDITLVATIMRIL